MNKHLAWRSEIKIVIWKMVWIVEKFEPKRVWLAVKAVSQYNKLIDIRRLINNKLYDRELNVFSPKMQVY